MRITRGNDAEEEKAYWADYGARIFRLSYLEDRAAMAVADSAQKLRRLRRCAARFRPNLWRISLAGRARNHAVNRTMIDWAAAGVFDYLIIPQDDTVDYGWNIAESRALRRYVSTIGRRRGYRSTLARTKRRCCCWRATLHSAQPSPRACGCATAARPAQRDHRLRRSADDRDGQGAPGAACRRGERRARRRHVLYINAPAEVQGNGPDQWALALRDAEIAALPAAAQRALASYRQQSNGALRRCARCSLCAATCRSSCAASTDEMQTARSQCAVVDVAFVNAGDLALGELLASECRR
jgi:hypothetical protein